jgi:hypothetical protein
MQRVRVLLNILVPIYLTGVVVCRAIQSEGGARWACIFDIIEAAVGIGCRCVAWHLRRSAVFCCCFLPAEWRGGTQGRAPDRRRTTSLGRSGRGRMPTSTRVLVARPFRRVRALVLDRMTSEGRCCDRKAGSRWRVVRRRRVSEDCMARIVVNVSLMVHCMLD